MNLRSYLRGAGLGLLVAALVLSFSGTEKTKAMSDDEVKTRARELGMTDGNEILTEAYSVTAAPEITETAAPSETAPEPVDEPQTEPVNSEEELVVLT